MWSRGGLDHSLLDSGVHTDTVHVTYQDRFGNTFEVDRNVHIRDSWVSTSHIKVNLINTFEFIGDTDNDNDHQLFYDFHVDDDPNKISIVYNGYGETIAIKENQVTTVRGQHGTLTFTLSYGNIKYHYTLDEKAEVDDIFSFTFTDADGSSSTAQIDVRTKFGIDVYEKELSSMIKLPEWLPDCRIIEVEVQGHAGYAWQNSAGEWIYQLDKLLDHSGSNGIITDEIIIWYRDANGGLSNVINDVFIHDSRPERVDFSMSTTNLHTITGTTAINGLEHFYEIGADADGYHFFVSGADGVEHEVVFESVMEIRGEHGLLSINASDGHLAYMYETDKPETSSDTFHFRIVDGDGTEVTSKFTLNTTFDENYDPNYGDNSGFSFADEDINFDALATISDMPASSKPEIEFAGEIDFDALNNGEPLDIDAPVTDIADIMADLSPNACLVYVDGELSIFDPGYNEGIEKLEQESKGASNSSSEPSATQEFIGTCNDFNSADMELTNAVNEAMAG